MLLGCIADDFTGAGDIANTLSRAGMRTQLFIGIPDSEAPVDADAEVGVIALKSRSVPVAKAVSEALRALRWLRARKCRQIVFKYCSTFDSTAEGNIGPVAEALAKELGVKGVVVCPSFPDNGRTVYQGHLFVYDRLLSDSGMERHPLTPMTDPDIRRWLRQQCTTETGHIDHSIVRAGSAAVQNELRARAQRGESLIVVDAICNEDLMNIGAALADAALVTGGSGIALGLPENFRRAGSVTLRPVDMQAVNGKALILSGSCSAATSEQVRRYADQGPSYCIDVNEMLAGKSIADEVMAFIEAHGTESPMIFSTSDPRQVRDVQQKYGRDRVASLMEGVFGDIAIRAVAAGVRRLVVAGGETSGAVVSALGLKSLRVGAEIATGVPVLQSNTNNTVLALALKSGNFGGADFFKTALNALGDNGD